jgi:hypothetical protein
VGRQALTAAWLFGMGLITYRNIARNHQPPIPGSLLAASGFFALLALVAEYPPAATAAALTGWGVDLAALMNLLPGDLAGPASAKTAAKKAPKTGTTQAPGTSTAAGRG